MTNALEDLDDAADAESLAVIKDVAAVLFVGMAIYFPPVTRNASCLPETCSVAGVGTTVASIHTFFLAMVNYPDVQCKAQEELDRVLQGRLPQLSDEADLPYISAIVKETTRWKPVVPLGTYIQVTSITVAQLTFSRFRYSSCCD